MEDIYLGGLGKYDAQQTSSMIVVPEDTPTAITVGTTLKWTGMYDEKLYSGISRKQGQVVYISGLTYYDKINRKWSFISPAAAKILLHLPLTTNKIFKCIKFLVKVPNAK